VVLLVLIVALPSGGYFGDARIGTSTPRSESFNVSTSPLAFSQRGGQVPAAAGIPGQFPRGEAYIDPVTLAETLRGSPGGSTLVQTIRNETTASSGSSLTVTVPTNVSGPPRDGPGVDYGWIVGTVVSAEPPDAPLSGALVSAEPLAGFCPSVGCSAVETGASGQFSVVAAVGENELLASDGYFLTNRTWTYVPADAQVSIGTMDLLEDAVITGTLEGSDAAHEPIPGVDVSSTSRDGSAVGTPSVHTNSLGQFSVPVPPVASVISFRPISAFAPYEPNTTFVDASPGESLDIGVLYLERTTEVELSIKDAESGAPISGTSASIQVCSRATGYCAGQGSTAGGPLLRGPAPVGPDTVQVYAAGYVLDTAVLGLVPPTAPGTPPLDMGTISLVPTGAIQLWVNITGIPAPYGSTVPTSVWPVGEYAVVTACSLDGLAYTYLVTSTGNMSSYGCTSACVSPGQESTLQGIPLRDYVSVAPDELGCITPGNPTWPIPGDLPVFDNYSWVNVTPGREVDAGAIDLLPGTYIEGEVLPGSETGWSVTACSTDETSVCGEGSYADSDYNGSTTFSPPTDCPQGGSPAAAITYCVAAPPGPVEIRVTPSNASANYTWAYDPPIEWGSLPLSLSAVDQDRSDVVNLSSATVSGRILGSVSRSPVPGLVSIQICPAGSSGSGVVCESGFANVSGQFQLNAPVGWDQVTAAAPQFVTNSTWVYVTHVNDTGTILLDPYGSVEGRVTNRAGAGLYEATVQVCSVVDPASCAPAGGTGVTGSDGSYYGSTPAGPTPVGAYLVEASAPGYSSDWTWVNVSSPGENFTVPTIVLAGAIASQSGDRPATKGAAGSSDPPGAWVVGQVVDARYGIGLPDASVTAEPLSGGAPISISPVRATDGEFNDSLEAGQYTLAVALPGYYPAQLLLNVSGAAAVVDVGTISLVPFPTVTGRTVIDPAGWREGVTDEMGLGPGHASVEICTNLVTVCGPGGIVSTSGYFNASAPAGTLDLLLADGTGTGTGTASGGFVDNRTYVNVTNSSDSSALAAPVGLSIFGIVTGSVVNANATSPAERPVRYDLITADTTFPVDATQQETLTADGTFAIVFPESAGLNMTAGGLGAWVPVGVGVTVNGTHEGGPGSYILSAGGTVNLAPMTLEHYGWVDAVVDDGGSGTGIPFATISADESGTLWGLSTTFSGNGVANAAGFVNVSAPPSIPGGAVDVQLNLSAPDYASSVWSVAVGPSATTYLNGTGVAHLGPIAIAPWGWVSGQVADGLTGAPLAGVQVAVSTGGVPAGRVGVVTNEIGEYRIDAPAISTDTVSLSLDGYVPGGSSYHVDSGEQLIAPPVRLTGDGIVGAQILSDPGSFPVAGASVAVCPSLQPECPATGTTNASGVFWTSAAPGLSVIAISAPGYATNATRYLTVLSDRWVWGGTIFVPADAELSGTILGLPNDLPVDGAVANICGVPASGTGAGPCFDSVPSAADGDFLGEVAAGNYVLQASAPGYNDSYLSVALAPGKALDTGVIFVQQYGAATGSVEQADTGNALPGATIVACESWGGDNCTGRATAGSDGTYVISGPAGPYVLEAEAPGYQASFEATTLVSGATVVVAPILLTPIGSGVRYEVSGRVALATGSGGDFAQAVVTATGGFSSSVSSSGSFSLSLADGNYTIAAEDPGYVTQTRSVEVTGPLTGIDFSLPVTTFAVSGVITDGLTNRTLGGVAILENGITLGVSSSDGAYSVPLANGSHYLVAQGPSPYAPLAFIAVVSGHAQSYPLALFPPSSNVNGLVVNSLTGGPLAGAAVSLNGTTADGTSWTMSVTSDADGRFVLLAYPGAYTAIARMGGFSPTQAALLVNATSSAIPLTLALQPATLGSAAPSSSLLWAIVGAVVAVGIVVVVLFLARRSDSPPSRPPSDGAERTDEDPDDSPAPDGDDR
jgi:hypothetical protein